MPAFARADLSDFVTLAAVVRRRSFSKAAIELGITTSAVSHTVRRLEERLGVRLLHRTNRTVTPTPVGAEFARRLEGGFAEISLALDEVAMEGSAPGELRLNVPHDAARMLLIPALSAFRAALANAKLSMVVENRPVDVIAEGFDAGIRYGDMVPDDMVAVPLTAPLRWVVAASPAYLQHHGRPAAPHDLMQHQCIGVLLGNNARYRWELGNGAQMVRLDVPGAFAVNNTDASIDAALAGIGLIYVPERRVASATASGALEIVLAEWASEGAPFCMYYPSRRQKAPALWSLINIIRQSEGLMPID
jgi:DNA-binding transcriptional LysR family regulator